jgi:hypothetical protein
MDSKRRTSLKLTDINLRASKKNKLQDKILIRIEAKKIILEVNKKVSKTKIVLTRRVYIKNKKL